MNEINGHATSPVRVEAVAPAWYSPTRPGVAGEWDGRAWTGATRPDPHAVPPPVPTRRLFGFLSQTWFWLFILGWLITVCGGIIGTIQSSENKWWLVLVAFGLIISIYGFLLIFERHLHFSDLPNLRSIAIAGVISGLVGFGISAVVQSWLEPLAKMPLSDQMWLTGLVEESAKLLVPLLLWKIAGDRFRDPRAGMLMVLISGATLGIIEGVFYILPSGEHVHLVMSGIRPLTEIAHPLFTAIAAAIIWLAAYRSTHLFTIAGLGGWALAAALHSLQDGVGAGGSDAPVDYGPMGEVIQTLLLGNALSALYAVGLFLVLRHFARELTPPTALAANSAHWRPQIKQWGVPRNQRSDQK
ncbi:PrsW family glutamic-type intramembrane protease [Rhodococcus sp. PAMC28705]|uniref:PrsW family glutamic-type intramembrane protease n=1 Tax=Rhodococcus sp. PAMC28705 TaxID=2565561 RepID=UPI001B34AE24|nr:PrsW family glutamic-type intramembrane protease [Rhodococcus sp. PAMC28705]